MSARLVVLASGSGSNLQAILDACASGELAATVVAVFSDQPEAYALFRALRAGVDAAAVPYERELGRRRYDRGLAEQVSAYRPDLVVLAGWMRILSNDFLQHCGARVINIHPALPGEFPGTHAIDRAFAERDSVGRTKTGVMVHFVPDEGVDDGPVIATVTVPINGDDSLESLAQRMHAAEHQLIVAAIDEFLDERL